MKKVSTPFFLALIYLAFSSIWIIASDAAAIKVSGRNQSLFEHVQSFKGLFFVLITSLFLYCILKNFYASINASLKKSKELITRYSALSEATEEGIADYDLVADKAEVNAQLKAFLDLPDLIINRFSSLLHERIHPDDRQRIAHSFQSTLTSSHNKWQTECRLLWNDRTYHDVIYRGQFIRDDKTTKPLRFICAFQDVSEIRTIQTSFYQKQLKQKQSLGITIIKAQEDERDRWALELHDNICQTLTVAKLYLDEVAAVNPDKLIPKAKDMVSNSLNEIRQLSASLKPPSFEEISLLESIEELYANIARVSILDFVLVDESFDETLLNDDHKLMIYRIVQEQLNNIMKYAEASQVAVRLWNTDKQFFIEVADDGKGCDQDKVKTGIGLRNIHNRLQVFSGKMELKTAPGAGCTLSGSFQV